MAAIKAPPGSPATFTAFAQDPDTLEALAGVPVFLDQRTSSTGPFGQVGAGQSDARGQLQLTVTLPNTPGEYTYRARTPGVADKFRSDTSKEVTIQVVDTAL